MIDRMIERQQERAQNPNAGNRRPDRGGRGGWANLTEAQREQRAKERLDRTTPKMRAQRDEFHRQLAERLRPGESIRAAFMATTATVVSTGGWGQRG